jgi:hypothetical protein
MNKVVAVAGGEAFGAYVDAREGSATYGAVVTVALVAGQQVVVPNGVGNGFQTVSETSQYLYCFDAEWQPGMAGAAVNPMDPALGIPWPLAPVLSDKDASAPGLRPGRKRAPAGQQPLTTVQDAESAPSEASTDTLRLMSLWSRLRGLDDRFLDRGNQILRPGGAHTCHWCERQDHERCTGVALWPRFPAAESGALLPGGGAQPQPCRCSERRHAASP